MGENNPEISLKKKLIPIVLIIDINLRLIWNGLVSEKFVIVQVRLVEL